MQKKNLNLSIYLIILPLLSKILSFLSRIILARYLNTTAMSYYTLLTPTIVILIACVQMSVPSILSKLVAQKNYEFKVLSTGIYFSIITTSLTTFIYLLCIPYLTHLLYKENFTLIFYCVLPYLPLVALSGLLKGYLLGKQKFIQSSLSQIIEEIVRILFLLIVFHYISLNNVKYYAIIAILSMSIGEIASSLYMLFNLSFHKKKINKLEYSYSSLKNIISLALPMSGSRFIGSFTYFLEPIVMNLFISVEESKTIALYYGNLNGYVLPLLTLPSFLSMSFANYLLPSYSYQSSRNNKVKANKILLFILYSCLILCSIYYLILYLFSDTISLILYNTIQPSFLIKQCSIPFILFSIQPILASIMHAENNSKAATIDTFVGCIVRLVILSIGIKIYKEKALILALCFSMLTTTSLHLFHVFLKKKSIYNT